jgi:tetratricopeptide (TPR) repeat protein
MSFKAKLLAHTLLIGAVVVITGCLPSVHSRLDEEKEPHFLEGKSRYNALDYQGAIESYEKAVEVNPQSGAAHLELGLLYEQNVQDFAAAIYHFQRFLTLRPKSEFEDRVKQQILACKQELAKSVSLPPISQRLQNDYEKLSVQNKQLTNDLATARAYIAQLERLTNQLARPAPVVRQVPSPALLPPAANPVMGMRVATLSSTGKTHTVKAGETPIVIAKKYGVRVESLMAANPRLDARRMQVGQSLNIPSS